MESLSQALRFQIILSEVKQLASPHWHLRYFSLNQIDTWKLIVHCKTTHHIVPCYNKHHEKLALSLSTILHFMNFMVRNVNLSYFLRYEVVADMIQKWLSVALDLTESNSNQPKWQCHARTLQITTALSLVFLWLLHSILKSRLGPRCPKKVLSYAFMIWALSSGPSSVSWWMPGPVATSKIHSNVQIGEPSWRPSQSVLLLWRWFLSEQSFLLLLVS